MCTPTRLSESSRAASRGCQNSFAVRAPRSSAWRVGPVSTTISQSPRLSRQAASAIVVHCRSGVIRRVPQVRARRRKAFDRNWWNPSHAYRPGFDPRFSRLSEAGAKGPLIKKGIWAAQVPPKVRIFAWRLSQEGLATQCNRHHRKLTHHATYQLCGAGDENRYHVVVQCPKARALRQELRGSWPLPDEEQFQCRGPDWLIQLLNSVSKEVGAHNLLMFWRAWYLRNDVVHGKGTTSIVVLAIFLISYAESLQVGR
jgi:hypothetical protein